MTVRVLQGDCRELLSAMPAESVDCVVTSPPYWQLRDYGCDGQLGLEATPGEFVEALVDVFREVRRVLNGAGTLWLNLGDTYIGGRNGGIGTNTKLGSQRNHLAARKAWEASGGRTHRTCPGFKPKDMAGIPWRVALALQADGWWLRSDIVWAKPSPMPERVLDRPTRAHEYVFLLSKSERYHYDAAAVQEEASWRGYETRNRRSVWTIAQEPYTEAHFATFPTKLVEPCILAGCPREHWDTNERSGSSWFAGNGVVLDPFAGAGTTGLVADRLGRDAILLELNPEYCELAEKRIRDDAPLLGHSLHTPSEDSCEGTGS